MKGGMTISERIASLADRVDRFEGKRILVVGDQILDEYRVGDVTRINPEAPVPIVRVQETRKALGGAGNVARGLVALGANASLATAIGDDAEGDECLELMQAAGVETLHLLRTPGRPTTHKLRVVARGQQMLRIDREETAEIDIALLESMRRSVLEALDGADALILQDYDKGLFRSGWATSLIAAARAAGVPSIADPKTDLARFRGADIVKPNEEEALSLTSGEGAGNVDHPETRRALLEKLQDRLGGSQVVMTRGAEGVSVLDRNRAAFDLPTRRVEVFDVQGAGDTTVAALALATASGADLFDASLLANAAASVVVSKAGTATVDANELKSRLPDALAACEGIT